MLPARAAVLVVRLAVPVLAAVAPGLYDGSNVGPASLEQALQSVGPGYAVIVSEQHDLPGHHDNQLAVLRALRAKGLTVSVGLEFLSYPDQPWVDRYVRGEVPESEFLREVRWAGYPFAWYRPLILFAGAAGGQARALNAPAHLTRALGQVGLAGLSDEDRRLLPPGFQLGSDLYFERFAAAIREHVRVDEHAIRNLFAAQSAWDDTMAWQAKNYLETHPEQVLVIIVGDFHASYGGGLPDRLRARGVATVLVISQVNGHNLSDEEILKLLAPHARYGPRADFVWLTLEVPPAVMAPLLGLQGCLKPPDKSSSSETSSEPRGRRREDADGHQRGGNQSARCGSTACPLGCASAGGDGRRFR